MSSLLCPICGKDDGMQMYGVIVCGTALAMANANNEYLQRAIRERNEARSEVERLTKERDEKNADVARLLAELAAEKVRSGSFAEWWKKAEAQLKNDSNACADELCWARDLRDGDPNPSLAVSEVLAQLRKTRLERNEAWARVSADASHAEKVLVAVAKEAAKVGAEDALGRVLELVGKEEEVAKKKRQGAPSHDSWTHWDGRREQAEVIGKRVAALKESP